jgi:DNA-binding SARP family transcriptional activator
MLRVEDDELDLHAFEHALEHGDPGRAAVLLREAESLWRGRPLADLEFEPFARFESQRLETLRLSAVEDRIEAELAVGRHTALCPELERLVTEHPLRERLRGQLMLALYRSGRQGDALGTYRVGRSLLVAELAVEPGPELRQLELAILGHDAALQSSAGEHRSATLVSPPASPAGEAAPGESSAEATRHRRPRRRARWAVLAPGLAAAFAGIALALLIGHTKAANHAATTCSR